MIKRGWTELVLTCALALLGACSSSKSESSGEKSDSQEERALPDGFSLPMVPVADALPRHALMLVLSRERIELDGKALIELVDGELGEPNATGPLDAALDRRARELVVAADSRVPFATLAAVLRAAHRAGVERIDLLVDAKRGGRSVLPVRWREGSSPRAVPGESLDFHVLITAEGYTTSSGPPMAPDPSAPGSSKPDVPVLRPDAPLDDPSRWDAFLLENRAKVAKVKFMHERHATLMAEPEIPVGAIVTAIAALRGAQCGAPRYDSCQFFDVILARPASRPYEAPMDSLDQPR